jgi:hypothetical protein
VSLFDIGETENNQMHSVVNFERKRGGGALNLLLLCYNYTIWEKKLGARAVTTIEATDITIKMSDPPQKGEFKIVIYLFIHVSIYFNPWVEATSCKHFCTYLGTNMN